MGKRVVLKRTITLSSATSGGVTEVRAPDGYRVVSASYTTSSSDFEIGPGCMFGLGTDQEGWFWSISFTGTSAESVTFYVVCELKESCCDKALVVAESGGMEFLV